MHTERAERLLIVNADDLGIAPGVTRGILELARLGVVTSTTLLPNLPGSLEALAAARELGLDVGLHLNLTLGTPFSPPSTVPSLLDRRGRFPTVVPMTRRHFSGRIRLDEVEREWTAQIEWFLATGARPSHLDSHNHVHSYPGIHAVILRLARRFGIRGVRRSFGGPGSILPLLGHYRLRRRPDHLRGHNRALYRTDYLTTLAILRPARSSGPFQRMLRALPFGVTELSCHPGHVDDELRRLDPMTTAREREWLQLARPLFRETLAAESVRLVSWAEVTAQE